MQMIHFKTRQALATFGLALTLVACGGDDGGSTTPAADASTTSRGDGGASNDASSPADSAVADASNESDAGNGSDAGAKTIIDVAVADGHFTTLAKALTDTGLVATLEGTGPFTVFAPTDAAFAALPAGTLEGLSMDQLKTVLTYHVVAKELPSSSLKSGPVATVSKLSAFVNVGSGGVKVNDATVTTADVHASNGVIHVIDKVLLPPNLVQAAQFAGSFTSLVSAVTKAGLADTLSADNANLTVFAPTDTAFAALPAGTVDGLSVSQLADLLKYHVVSGEKLSTDLTAGSLPTLLSGKSITVDLTGGVKINDANVVIPDVVTTNGVIHAIDKVLTIPN